MATMTHFQRYSRILSILREVPCGEEGAQAKSPNGDGWITVKVPRVGMVTVHRMSQEGCKLLGCNEVFVQYGPSRDISHESFRGSAEAAAIALCKRLKAPSKAVATATETILSRWLSGNPANRFGCDTMRAPEVAAWLGLDEMVTYKAFDHLQEMGLIRDEGDRGLFRQEPTNERIFEAA